MTTRRIHLWAPNMFEFRGGIQVYSTFVLKGLCELHPDWEIDVFLLHDIRGDVSAFPRVTFHCSGGVPALLRKPLFAIKAGWGACMRKPDLILSTHLHFGPLAKYIRRWSGIPYWLVAHGVEAWNMKSAALRAAVVDADRILAVSEFTKKSLVSETGVQESKVAILANTLEEGRFHLGPKPEYLLRRYGFSASDRVILSVCRLDAEEPHKGLDRVLEALTDLRQKIPNVRYLIIGQGSDRTRIEGLVRTLGLEHTVALAGFVPDEQLGDHYNLCDLFALPSTGEGFGIVFLEALACGKPVVAGNVDGSSDPLGGGELGVLIDPAKPFELTAALASVLLRTHENQLLYQPTLLRQKMLERFGMGSFKSRLAELTGAI